MAKKNTSNQTEMAGTAATERKPAQKSEIVTQLQAQLKEAKKLERLLATIPELSLWGIQQLNAAIAKRQEVLSAGA